MFIKLFCDIIYCIWSFLFSGLVEFIYVFFCYEFVLIFFFYYGYL